MGEAGAVMMETDDRPTYADRIAALSVGGVSLDLRDPRPLKLTVDDLVLLDRHWQDDDHKSTELIDGRIYTTPARYMPRGHVMQEIWLQLRERAAVAAPHLFVGMRGSVEISPYDLPLPDIVVTSEMHGEGFISVASVPLVVEVVETALAFYMGEKLRLYARAGIPEYWVADIATQTIKQLHGLVDEEYRNHDVIPFGSRCVSATVPNLQIETVSLIQMAG